MLDNEIFENDKIAQELVAFYANPADQRTLQAVANDLGIDYVTLYRHEKKWRNEIFAAADKMRKQYMPGLLAKGYKVLEGQLKKSPKALELLFKLTGELVERVEQTNKYESADVKRQKLGDMLGKFGIKLVVDNTPLNGSQLPQVERLPHTPPSDTKTTT